MKLGIFGNNLNFGYFLTRLLRPHFEAVTLLLPEYPHEQEQHHWWTDEPQAAELVKHLPRPPLHHHGSLASLELIRRWYDEAGRYDVLLMSEFGPALFSELRGTRKILVSYGDDMQDLPFFCRRQLPKAIADCFWNEPKRELTAGSSFGAVWRAITAPLRVAARARLYLAIQNRQRAGLRDCDALACSPYQREIVHALRLDEQRVRYLPLPMDCDVLSEVDDAFASELRQEFAQDDLVLFHPTRQFHLPGSGDIYKKDNLQLIRGFDRFLQTSKCRARLLLVRKGEARDIAVTEQLIAKLGRDRWIQWIPEMPNKRLRAYYTLANTVVCDQFSPNCAILGNIGREASFFGRILVTAFRSWNSELYGPDMPPHVFPAEKETEVAEALLRIFNMSPAERAGRGAQGREWFDRQHAAAAVLPKWLALINEVARADIAGLDPESKIRDSRQRASPSPQKARWPPRG